MNGFSVGFVPTMGFLHEGHLSLVKKSKELCDKTVVSIFVNPTQFSPSEDLKRYPRDIERDSKYLEDCSVDYLFLPGELDIYPENFQTFVNVEKITKHFEGESRPTHFRGVTTIVNILLNCINPDYAFFGQKDAQQAAVIKRMISDLKIPVNIVVCPIVREPDGLAMSSRNVYLSKKERSDALILSNSLRAAISTIKDGEHNVEAILKVAKSMIHKVSSAKIDYIQIVESGSFELIKSLEKGNEYFIVIACWIGKTRLIDNEIVKI